MRDSSGSRSSPRLLTEGELIRTGPVDYAVWNYRGLLGRISRVRFALALALLPAERVGSLLELGYGSGIFLRELATHCTNLFGADIHGDAKKVAEILARRAISATLRQASAGSLPFPDESMDVVVAISALEFVEDLPAMSAEIARVLKPGGSLVMVMPGDNVVLDVGLRVLAGTNAKDDFGDRRRRVVPALLRHLRLETEVRFPRTPFGTVMPVYRALRLRRP